MMIFFSRRAVNAETYQGDTHTRHSTGYHMPHSNSAEDIALEESKTPHTEYGKHETHQL